MSAVLVFRSAESVSLITDAAHYDVTGQMLAFAPKSYAFPHLNAVMAWRGGSISSIAGTIIEAIGPLSRYDDIEGIVFNVLRTWAAVAEANEQPVEPFEIHVAGVSETRGVDSWVMNNHRHQVEIAPYTRVSTGPVLVAPGNGDIHEMISKRWSRFEDLVPERDAVEIMNWQRQHKFPANFRDGDEICIVGGFALCTTVWPDRMESKIIHRWPDKIGETIRP